MDCEQALALISSRIDREILPSENAWLSEHLRECAACRATAEAFALQHAELKDTFAPRRAAVGATVDRVNATVADGRRAEARRRRLKVPRKVWVAGAASVRGGAGCRRVGRGRGDPQHGTGVELRSHPNRPLPRAADPWAATAAAGAGRPAGAAAAAEGRSAQAAARRPARDDRERGAPPRDALERFRRVSHPVAPVP